MDATIAHGNCCELHLSRSTDGGRRVLLWPFDRPIANKRLRRPVVVPLRRWIRVIGRAAGQTIDPATPRTRMTAAEILPYQLAPAIEMAAGASRMLLADEVGLGKTVQAGWIISDLVEREPGARVLIAVPAGLRRQWSAELSRFFAISTIGVDARWLRDTVAEVPAEVSPWSAPGVYVGSIDFLKRADVASALQALIWDLVVIDEAHAATAPTERHAALSGIARRARRVVSISATPYSGNPAGFASLAALGGASGETPPLMFRRAREHAGDARARRHHFATVRISAAEIRLQRLLERYSRDVWREAPGDADAARLAVTILRKRALSSPASAARSLTRRLELLRGSTAAPRQLSLFDEEDALDDDLPHAALAAPGLADTAREQRWLTVLIDAANHAVPHDSKERYVLRFLRRLGSEPVILFTEYRDTLLQLARALPPALHLHGGLTTAARAEVQRRFNADGGLLLATDAAAEGLNLQRRCRTVVNFELPWNPARLEQRIGRIDRIGQRRTVHAVTLVARDTAEDLVIANLAKRLARVAATLGDRDRLAAFLTDTRTARIVIGGAPDVPEPEPFEPVVVPVAPPTDVRTLRAAEQVRWRRCGPPDDSLFIASVRASPALPGGFVFAVRCAAQTCEGRLVAARLVIVHAIGDVSRPAKAAAARRAAELAIERLLPRAIHAVRDADSWFADVAREHDDALQRQSLREAALTARGAAGGELQPGLFDRRALLQAERESAVEERLRAEHRERLASLQRERALNRTIAVAGVLVVWR